jgi:hypothetical protein
MAPAAKPDCCGVPQAQFGPIRVPEGAARRAVRVRLRRAADRVAAVEFAEIPAGGSVAVLGLGLIGQMSARIARSTVTPSTGFQQERPASSGSPENPETGNPSTGPVRRPPGSPAVGVTKPANTPMRLAHLHLDLIGPTPKTGAGPTNPSKPSNPWRPLICSRPCRPHAPRLEGLAADYDRLAFVRLEGPVFGLVGEVAPADKLAGSGT